MTAPVGAPSGQFEDIPEEDAAFFTFGDMLFRERRELDDSVGD